LALTFASKEYFAPKDEGPKPLVYDPALTPRAEPDYYEASVSEGGWMC